MKFKSKEQIQSVIDEIAVSMGIKIFDIEVRSGKENYITIFIDKVGGVDLLTCEAFHRKIDSVLDELDPTYGQPYTLNVSSAGADRPFKTDEDFISHVGQKVEVKLKQSIKGKKFYEGILISYDGKVVTVKVDDKNTFTIELKNLAKMNEYIQL